MGVFSSFVPLQASRGRHPDLTHVDPRLVEMVSAGASHLPPGYTVTVNDGFNPFGHAVHSQHHIAGKGALDVQIWDPQGRPIPNEGSDATGMYHLLAQHAYGEMQARHPDLNGRFAWGGSFGTHTGGTTPDLMHFDLGGERGNPAAFMSRMGPARSSYGRVGPPQTSNPDAAMVSAAKMVPVGNIPWVNGPGGAPIHAPGPIATATGGAAPGAAPGGPAGLFGGMGFGGGGGGVVMPPNPRHDITPSPPLEAAMAAQQANEKARQMVDFLLPAEDATVTSGGAPPNLFGDAATNPAAAEGVFQRIFAKPQLAQDAGGIRYRA